MAKISEIVFAPKAFEIVRSKICSILADEIAAQKVMLEAYKTNNPTEDLSEVNLSLDSLPSKIYEDRLTRFNEDELDPYAAVNVMFSTKKTAELISASNDLSWAVFTVECWTKSKASPLYQTGEKSFRLMHRLLGGLSAILQNPAYRFLALEWPGCPVIQAVDATEVMTSNPEYGAESASFTITGALFIKVRLRDNKSYLGTQTLVHGIDTDMQISDVNGTYWKTDY